MRPASGAPNTLIRPRDLTRSGWTRILFSKVPEVTLLFWVVKVLSTAVGQSAVDFLAHDVGLGLAATTAVMGLTLATVLIGQFSLRRYVPGVYWLAVMVVGIVGALLSDDVVDGLGVSPWTTATTFAVGLAATLLAWYGAERTLSIHTVVTRRREAFYWLAILFAVAIGASVGALLGVGPASAHVTAVVLTGAMVTGIAIAYRGGLNAVAVFWTAYVATWPVGAGLGDVLTATRADGGLGLGAAGASATLLVVILALVCWFTVQERRRRGRVASSGVTRA